MKMQITVNPVSILAKQEQSSVSVKQFAQIHTVLLKRNVPNTNISIFNILRYNGDIHRHFIIITTKITFSIQYNIQFKFEIH